VDPRLEQSLLSYDVRMVRYAGVETR
jgi:hypothetical protein